jgi:hypothetical protein
MTEERRATRKVRCSVPNGIELRRYAPGFDDGTGQRPLRALPGSVVIPGPSSLEAGANAMNQPGVVTEVDAEFIDGWMKENAKSELVTSGFIAIVDDDGENPDDGH